MATEPQVGTRRQILDAAERVIAGRGIRGATTKAIAEAAGCAEGSIYRHFLDRHALLIECIGSRFPEFNELVASLPGRVGKGSVRRTLEEVSAAALSFYRTILPMVGGSIAEPELLEAQRRHFRETGAGPMRVLGSVSSYLRGEQRLGRISGRVPPERISRLLLGALFGQAFLERLVGDDARVPSDELFVKDTVRVVLDGTSPRPPLVPGGRVEG